MKSVGTQPRAAEACEVPKHSAATAAPRATGALDRSLAPRPAARAADDDPSKRVMLSSLDVESNPPPAGAGVHSVDAHRSCPVRPGSKRLVPTGHGPGPAHVGHARVGGRS